MTLPSGRARLARSFLAAAALISAMALSTGSAAAGGPSAGFTVDTSTLSFPDAAAPDATSTATFTITTGKKDAVIQIATDFGPYSLTGGDCFLAYDMQVPAGTSCQVTMTFSPSVAGSYPGTLTLWNCQSWFILGSAPVCSKTHGSVTISYTGTGI